MGDTDGPPDVGASGASSPATADRALPHLKRVRWLLQWSMRLVIAGFLMFLLVVLLGSMMPESESQIFFFILQCLVVVCPILFGVGLLGTCVFGVLWFGIVYFAYTRYSLRTLLLTIWLGATAIALIVAFDEGLRGVGIAMLVVLLIVLFFRIAVNDPLGDPRLKEIVAPNAGRDNREPQSHEDHEGELS